MKYLVFGDVHANLPALEAVLAAGDQHRVDGYLFVGDIVGYGPDPLGCIERLVALRDERRLAWVAGNHELVVRGDVQPVHYSGEAMATLEWTRRLLQGEQWALDFLATGHPSLKVYGGIWLAHDSLVTPSTGLYHRHPQNAKTELAFLAKKHGVIGFYGHTHTLRAEVQHRVNQIVLVPMQAHTGAGVDPRPLQLAAGEIAWIGAGSVGFPTNPERHAEFLVVDDATWRVEKYAVAYPRAKAQARVREVVGAACGQDLANRIAQWL